MKKGIIIGIIIIIAAIGTISYSIINQNSNPTEIIPSDLTPERTGVDYSIELTEGITMTAPSP